MRNPSGGPSGELSIDYPVVISFASGSTPIPSTVRTRMVTLPAIPENVGAPFLSHQVGPKQWQPVQDQKFINGQIVAQLKSTGYYQVFAPLVNSQVPFSFGEVFVFPNPTREGQIPTLHIEVRRSDEVTARIYDVSGDLVFETRINGEPIVVDGNLAYEVPLNANLFKSGVYVGAVTAKREDKETIRKSFRFSVLK